MRNEWALVMDYSRPDEATFRPRAALRVLRLVSATRGRLATFSAGQDSNIALHNHYYRPTTLVGIPGQRVRRPIIWIDADCISPGHSVAWLCRQADPPVTFERRAALTRDLPASGSWPSDVEQDSGLGVDRPEAEPYATLSAWWTSLRVPGWVGSFKGLQKISGFPYYGGITAA